MVGLYVGPHGLWYAIRLHFWSCFIGVSFKWLTASPAGERISQTDRS